ncbi:MAG: Hydrolase [Frankiales bacterium]|nr:Hydrolase [Frankiales bacterium]
MSAVTSVASGVARAGMRKMVKMPSVPAVPEGRLIDLPGRGRTYLVDVPGPTPEAPTVVLLHALGCTAYLTWYSVLVELSKSYRVVAFDQRWHGRGIRSPRFRLDDCADDAVAVMDELGIERAVVAGYSMGGLVSQLVAHRHPDRVLGLVLCATARNFRGKRREKLFFPVMTVATSPLAGYALARVERVAELLPEAPSLDASTPAFGREQFRSTSAWSMPEVLAELGRFNSAPWVGEISCPTASVITDKDHAIPASRQRRLAASIPGTEVFEIHGGHISLVVKADAFREALSEAIGSVVDRLAKAA